MTQLEAEHKAQDLENLYQDAECEEQNGCHGAAERARNEARIIEEELRVEGKDPAQILRQIEARRRAL